MRSHKNRRTPEKKVVVAEFAPRAEGCPTPTKHGFETRARAKAYLKKIRHGKTIRDGHMAVYLCVCGLFHLGHLHPAGRAKNRAIAQDKVESASQLRAPASR